jgi:quercetin dioxygenase-like cupin family protein
MNPEHAGPVFVSSGAGAVLEALSVTHKLTSDQTDGSCYVFESTLAPGEGNRMHRHQREDEICYVLDGAVEVRLGDGFRTLETGAIARLPKGIAHAIRNPSMTPSRYLFIAVPAGLDQWFDAVARATESGSLDDAGLDALARAYGIDWLE